MKRCKICNATLSIYNQKKICFVHDGHQAVNLITESRKKAVSHEDLLLSRGRYLKGSSVAYLARAQGD